MITYFSTKQQLYCYEIQNTLFREVIAKLTLFFPSSNYSHNSIIISMRNS